MPTSLQGRAKKAAHDKFYRFRHSLWYADHALCAQRLAAPATSVRHLGETASVHEPMGNVCMTMSPPSWSE